MAISVERRPVRPEEVRPPLDLFALVQWPRLDPARAAERGHEVLLTSRLRGAQRALLRGQGNFASSRQEGRGSEGVYYSGSDGRVRYAYHVDERGRAVRLEAGLVRPRGWGGNARWEAVPGRRPQRVLGERCIWQDETSIRSTDIHYECLTADGIPLMTETHWHWTGETEIERARSIVRRPLIETELNPPPEARRWLTWLVTPPVP